MNVYVKAVESMVSLAGNLKPSKHVNTGNTKAETIEMITQLKLGIQKQLIAYECLQAAVILSKDNKAISKNMEKLLDEKIKELAGE
jgi:hypothetical protein